MLKMMAANYDFFRKPGLNSSEEPQLVPRIVSKGTIHFEKLIKMIAEGTTFQKGDLEGAMQALVDHLVFHLKHGHVVELEGLGFFSLKLRADRPVTDKKQIHAQSIKVVNVNFRPAASLVKEVRSTRLQRDPKGFVNSGDIPPERRKQLLDTYLNDHPYIRRSDYTRITGRQKNAALKDLNEWVKEGYIKKDGSGSHVVYLKTPPPNPEK